VTDYPYPYPQQQPLVAGPYRVTLYDRGDPPRPGVALVFTRDDGQPVNVARRPTVRESRQYGYRYEVDVTTKGAQWSDQLTSRTAPFQADIHAVWHVEEPEKAVSEGLVTPEQGESIVRTGLKDVVRSCARTYHVEDCVQAEELVNASFNGRTFPLNFGITVTHLSVRLSLDEETEKFLLERTSVERELELEPRRHELRVQQSQSDHDIELRAERQRIKVESLRREALRAAAGEGDLGLLLQVAAQEPAQLHTVLRELAASEAVERERKLAIFQELMKNKLIHPAEVESTLRLLTQPGPAPAPPQEPKVINARATSLTNPKNTPNAPEADTPADPARPVSRGGQAGGVVGWKPIKRRQNGSQNGSQGEAE
jgi:hypothetical protein